MEIPRITHEFAAQCWAITEGKFAEICAFLTRYAAGDQPIHVERSAANGQPAYQLSGDIAVLPLMGTICQRANMLTDFSGGCSTEAFAKRFQAAIADPIVRDVVINVDSPGGSVYGVAELSDLIFAARGKGKKITAIANSLSASAAYWIASQADEMSVTPGGEVGSIGVFSLHEDDSGYFEALGVKFTMIRAGKYKGEGNPYEPLTTAGLEFEQSRVEDYYAMFTKAVARGRSVAVSAVRGGFGEGRVVGAQSAVSLGMCDRVETLDDCIARLGARRRAAAQRAAIDQQVIEARIAGIPRGSAA